MTTQLGNAGVPQGPATARSGFHYGSAASSASTRSNQSLRPQRIRSRDRGRWHRGADQDDAESRHRAQPAGPQDLQDRTEALAAVNDRLDLLDRYSMLHAPSVAHLNDDHALLSARLESMISPVTDRVDHAHARINESAENARAEFSNHANRETLSYASADDRGKGHPDRAHPAHFRLPYGPRCDRSRSTVL